MLIQNRRRFLKRLTMLSSALCAPTFLVRSVKAARELSLAPVGLGNPSRILVVIELAGGCDGLNTVIPYSNDRYLAARPNLGLRPGPDLLTLDDSFAFHPAMTGLKELWDQGVLSIIHGVGYPNPNRSHFRSRDIWHTAEPENVARDGWLADYFSSLENPSSLQGLNIGGRVPRAMVSSTGSSPSIQSIDTYQLQTDPLHPEDASNKNAAFQQILSEAQNRYRFQEYVTQTVLDATLSSVQLLEGRQNYHSTVEYPNTALADSLRTMAQVMASDLGVTVFYTTISGFDTHANQVVGGSNAAGTHATLLGTLSGAIKAFYDDLVQMGRQEEVLILTFSEFGRRLSENGSLGTDHGTANQMFAIGAGVKAGMVGTHPGLEPGELDPIGDMIYTADFRSVYAAALANWLGADAKTILGGDWLDSRIDFV